MNKIDELFYKWSIPIGGLESSIKMTQKGFHQAIAKYEQSQWHDLRDNPEDLPNDTNDRYCAYKLRGRIAYKLALYYKANKEWYDIGSNKITPIAWREPPKWEKN